MRRRSPSERGYYDQQDDAAEEFFREAAAKEGLTYHAWCDKYGVLDEAALRTVRRHEAPLMMNEFERINKAPSVLRGIRRVGERAVDPRVLTASDFDPPSVSPAKRRPVVTDNDAAAE